MKVKSLAITTGVIAASVLMFGIGTALAMEDNGSVVPVEVTESACEPTTLKATWNEQHELFNGVVGNTVFVLFDGTTTTTHLVGTSVQVGPFDQPTEIKWRVSGGAERDYDNPSWNGYPFTKDSEALNNLSAYLDEHGDSWVAGGPDDNPFVNWNTLTLNGCVTPQVPTVEQYDCVASGTAAGELVIPDQEGVEYQFNGEMVSGVVPVNNGTYTVTAHATDGYSLNGETEWSLTVHPISGCQGPPGTPGEEPTDNPSEEPSATPTETPSESASATETPSATTAPPTSNGGNLPTTGAKLISVGLAGLGMVTVGMIGILWSRRNRDDLMEDVTE